MIQFTTSVLVCWCWCQVTIPYIINFSPYFDFIFCLIYIIILHTIINTTSSLLPNIVWCVAVYCLLLSIVL